MVCCFHVCFCFNADTTDSNFSSVLSNHKDQHRHHLVAQPWHPSVFKFNVTKQVHQWTKLRTFFPAVPNKYSPNICCFTVSETETKKWSPITDCVHESAVTGVEKLVSWPMQGKKKKWSDQVVGKRGRHGNRSKLSWSGLSFWKAHPSYLQPTKLDYMQLHTMLTKSRI